MRTTVRRSLLVSASAAVLLGGVVGTAGPAAADPPTTPRVNDIVSVGNDTIGPLMNQISADYNAQSPAPTNKFYSFDPYGSTPITPKSTCASVYRPAGANSGIVALQQNASPSSSKTSYCIDIAGSSRAKKYETGLSFVQFAQDAVTWSKTSTSATPSNAPTSLSDKELQAIYSCDASLLGGGATGAVTWNEVGGTGTERVLPVLPQAGSGTRSFFLGAIGVTTPGSCVSPTTPADNEGTDAVFKTTAAAA